ncbi:uncharacterized protein H6S33_003510 [Morchella sextelata]|uniref:uncharacterized protein n=1 Tax=Morchella sextelata TaxID=1174677 RepID=UPI001D03A153|nr:uncharacterized protein H6S33_003510 [Morchella sextelata]KAH0606676.1 hypothetical protein H6S33_003510 [Morchella sextelata]
MTNNQPRTTPPFWSSFQSPSVSPPSVRTPLLQPVPSTADEVPFWRHKLPRAAWAYPLYGIYYLLANPALLPPLLSRVVPLLILSILVLTIIFTFLYLPQVAILLFFNGPLAFANAAILCLSEAAAIITFVAENFMTEEKIVETFDGVLLTEAEKLPAGLRLHIYGLIARCRELHLGSEGALEKLGKHKESPYLRFSLRLTVEFILELPLNLIPLVGPPLFIVLQGYHLGPLSHYRYIQLVGLSDSQKKQFIAINRWRYWLFGLVHVMLQITPVLSILFLFTSAAGAALWAVEDQKRLWFGNGAGAADPGAEVGSAGWWKRMGRVARGGGRVAVGGLRGMAAGNN